MMDNIKQSRGAPSEEIFDAVQDVMHLWRSQLNRPAIAAGREVTHLEAKTLGFFTRRPGATLSDLAEHSGRDKSQLARLVAGLRERGLLEAHTDEADRRNIRLQPTAAALDMHRAIQQKSRQMAQAGGAGLDDGGGRQVLAPLARLREGLLAGDR